MNTIKISEEVIEKLSSRLTTHKITLDDSISSAQVIIDDINKWDVNIQKSEIVNKFINVVENKAKLRDIIEEFDYNVKNNLQVLIEEDEILSKKIGAVIDE